MTLEQELLSYYKQNIEDFNNDIEALDDWTGYLGGERAIPMEELDDYYQDISPLDLLRRAFFGYDEECSNSKQKAPFNPNRDYFYVNGYINLVSTDNLDYSNWLDEVTVDNIIDNSQNLMLSDGAQDIIDEYEDQDKEQGQTENGNN